MISESGAGWGVGEPESRRLNVKEGNETINV